MAARKVKMPTMKATVRALAACLLAAGCGAGFAQALTPAEVEARNAAAGFAISSLATLGMLRDECETLTGDGPDGAAAIARAWWDRNQDDLAAAYAWTDHYLSALRQKDEALWRKTGRDFHAGTSSAVRDNARLFFRGQLPTAATCAAALQMFREPAAGTPPPPGHERFAQASATLRRIRADAGYRVPPGLQMDAERHLHRGLSASLETAQDALRRRDAQGARVAFESMAARGDAKAAQALGAMYMEGDLLARDDLQAYRWFYRAWLLRDAEGLNALGVLRRDGRVGTADPKLALALFQLAAAQAPEGPSRKRAERNRDALAGKMPLRDRDATACMSLRQIADAVEAPLPAGERGSSQLFSPNQTRRLGESLPGASPVPLPCD